MEVVSTSKKSTTACNFQRDYVMTGQIGSYAYIQI